VNLVSLFQMQKVLDERIVKEHRLEEQDLLPKKILALQVELGELANETRCFKFWSLKGPSTKEKILEEYVDCLHFILSIGLEILELENLLSLTFKSYKTQDISFQFNSIFYYTSRLLSGGFCKMVETFLGLGEMLGFSDEDIMEAYLEKNKINHQRQEEGY